LQLIPSEELNEKNCLDILSRLEFAINHDFNVDFFEENGYEYGTEY
jgi:hypothetical protein